MELPMCDATVQFFRICPACKTGYWVKSNPVDSYIPRSDGVRFKAGKCVIVTEVTWSLADVSEIDGNPLRVGVIMEANNIESVEDAMHYVSRNNRTDTAKLEALYRLTDLGIDDEDLGHFTSWLRPDNVIVEEKPPTKGYTNWFAKKD